MSDVLRIGDRGADAIDYMTDHFDPFFQAVSTILLHLLRWTYLAISSLHAVVMIAVFTAIALLVTRRLLLSAGLAAGLLVIYSMNLWIETMQSMASVIVASAIALAVGIPLGIWSVFSHPAQVVLRPVLDFMQTLPVFVYLLPTILFFGIGEVPGLVATVVFAIPPAVRLTQLGIREVDAETVEAARAFGATKPAILRDVQLPLAMPSIMTGVNQVIMLSLSMVVVAGLVGGGGLGDIVVSAVLSVDVADAIESGLAVVILAIYLDRVSAALGGQGRGQWSRRRRVLVGEAEQSKPERPVMMSTG